MFYFSVKGTLNQYLPLNRNLLKSDKNKKSERNCILYTGKQNIVHILEKLPKTKHDFGSFEVDVPWVNVSTYEYFYLYQFLNIFFFF